MRPRRSRASARLPLSSARLAVSRPWLLSLSLRIPWLDSSIRPRVSSRVFSMRPRFFSSDSAISLWILALRQRCEPSRSTAR